MDYLGRYYTDDQFSNLLIRNLQIHKPETIIDLGAGGGSLIRAAHRRWSDAQLIAADIDNTSVKKLSEELPFVKVHQANGLKINVEKAISIGKSSIDVAICNPPYLQIRDKRMYSKLLSEVRLTECLNLNKLTSDVVFLAQNLKLLKEGGELGIIVPDSLLTGQEFRLLRESILTNHGLRAVIELPANIFPRTEAKTHILLLQNKATTKDKVPLFIAGRDGLCYDEINVTSSMLCNRMDFSYHEVTKKYTGGNSKKKLGEFNLELKRGSKSNAELRVNGTFYLHSTSFKNGQVLNIKNTVKQNEKKLCVAKSGDIIIVRVGRRCVGKIAFIKSGSCLISDCLYVLRTDQKLATAVFRFLSSKTGEDWVKAISHGVCAKVLSRLDILNIPTNLQ